MSKAEHTRAFIIERIASIFNKKGYAGTSLGDLTAATGLTKGALYGNFKNKDHIAAAVYDFNVEKIRNFQSLNITAPKTAIDKLLNIPATYKEHYNTIAKDGGCPILNTAIEADDNQPLLKKKVKLTIKSWKNDFATIITQGIDAGEIKPEVDPLRYAVIFIALFEGGMMLSKVTGDPIYFYQAMDKMVDIINIELKMTSAE